MEFVIAPVASEGRKKPDNYGAINYESSESSARAREYSLNYDVCIYNE